MPRDRLARSQRSAVRVSVTVLALALGLTLAGSQATASTSTLAVSPSTVGNGANLRTVIRRRQHCQFDQLDRHLRARAGTRQVGSITYEYAPDPSGTVTFRRAAMAAPDGWRFYVGTGFSGRPSPWPANPAIQLGTADSDLLTAQYEVDFNPAPTVPVVNQPFPPL